MVKIVLSAFLFVSSAAYAADSSSPDDFKFWDRALTLSGGRMLPYDVYGVRDIYPYWGIRLTDKIWGIYPEYSLTFINSEDVNFYSGSISVMFPDKFPGFTLLSFLGADAHYYSGHTKTKKLPFVESGGFHLGASPVIEITERIGLRVDFKLNFGPGMQLLVGAGLAASF